MFGIFDNNKVLHLPKTYELTPEYDQHKSFYGRATMQTYYIAPYTINILLSYETPVLMVAWEHIDRPTIYRLWGDYSRTTQRHINEFLIQNCWDYTANGEPLTGKKAWLKMPLYNLNDVINDLLKKIA